MMILLTVIAVGLLTLSAVSLRTASQGEAAAAARANARMALMMAIGELQRELGPDSRISAPHDAGNSATGGQPHWTAVYDAWEKPAANDAETPGSRDVEFRGWLVSGANEPTGGAAGTSEKVMLVGPNSLGGSASADDEVRVPTHAVRTGDQAGRIAWWTADEAMKARINAGPDPGGPSSLGISDPLFHSQSPPNVGHRSIPRLSDFDWEDGQRAITVSTAAVQLAAGAGADGLGNMSHDFTVHSAGVLADVRAGRLKRDLSNLLSRPVNELEDKPLFLADGRINDFSISSDGAVSNGPGIGGNTAGNPDEWGINLEELGLFHQLHRELSWNGGTPSLMAKSSRESAVRDRFFIYRKPTVEAVQFILSLKAVPTGGGKYKMQMMLDGLVALTNPNDVRMEIPPGLDLPLQLLNIPYDLKWDIEKSDGTVFTATKNADEAAESFKVFMGYIEGGTGGRSPAGFALEPGESAVFGSSSATGFKLNLKRGFEPSGGVTMTGWNLGAEGLQPADSIDFELKRITSPAYGSNYTYYNFWLGPRVTGAGAKGWQLDTANLTGGGIDGALMNQLLPETIRPSQVLRVSDFIHSPKPFLMFSFLRNVERDSGTTPPDAFASRPFVLNDPALSGHVMRTSDIESIRHLHQTLITAEPMNYQFRTLAAGDGGRNVYHGGGRQPNLGGSFRAIARRIPLAPPLSLGAFQNAIACGLIHINEPGGMPAVDPVPANATALSPWIRSSGSVSASAKLIGNSYCPPYLGPDQVFRAKSGNGGSVAARSATDKSWIANTALWDSWFLSGIADGTGPGSSPWLTDPRSERAQFEALAGGEGDRLRNTRYLFHPHKNPEAAVSELFDGEKLKPSALIHLPKYLLVDGAFNVNSTSVAAWEALLSSVRGMELLAGSGTTRAFAHPFGTLGYANSTATTGTEGDWSGLRDLDENQIESLATAIVAEVKDRGPFLSMADFVNRRPDSGKPAHQALGALQAAIDRSGLNDHVTGPGRSVTSADLAPLAGSDVVEKEPKAARATGSPGHLSQADVLTAIGSQITVRSDTFTIRCYGDSRDASGEVRAKAWCEAVVQRVPEYVDPKDPPEAADGWPDSGSQLSATNSRFGRRLLIQSFRWLGDNDI